MVPVISTFVLSNRAVSPSLSSAFVPLFPTPRHDAATSPRQARTPLLFSPISYSTSFGSWWLHDKPLSERHALAHSHGSKTMNGFVYKRSRFGLQLRHNDFEHSLAAKGCSVRSSMSIAASLCTVVAVFAYSHQRPQRPNSRPGIGCSGEA